MTIKTLRADVVIAGAGSAGVAAAVAAAELDVRVVIIEKNLFAGGKATAAMVGTVCGLFLTHPDEKPQWSAGGLMRNFAEELAVRSKTDPLRFYERLHVLPYKINAFKALCNDWLDAHNVHTLWGAEIIGVHSENKRISSVDVSQGAEIIRVEATQWVECTGDAVLTRLANHNWVKGDENQAAARVFRLDGIQGVPADAIHFALSLALRRGVQNQLISEHLAALTVVPGSYQKGSAYFKLPLPQEVTNNDEQRAEMLESSTFDIQQVVGFLQKHAAPFARAVIAEMAPEVGFRTGFRGVGRETLTEAMVADCVRHNDGIANGAWPVEYWKPGENAEIEFFSDGDYYQIPAGCLESQFAENLYFAGRNISAAPRALASARVMGTCLQTGFAAGTMAAHAVSGISRDESIAFIRLASELDL
jgi:hypothetical protein